MKSVTEEAAAIAAAPAELCEWRIDFYLRDRKLTGRVLASELEAAAHAIRNELGHSKSARINTLVLSCIENSSDDIRLEKGIWQVFDELHKFMFEKVYTNPACKSEESKALDMIQRLYAHFAERVLNAFGYSLGRVEHRTVKIK